MISGSYDLGPAGDFGGGVWPAFAPRLGSGLRNIQFGGFTPSFNSSKFVNLTGFPLGNGGLPAVLKPLSGLSQLVGTTTGTTEAPLLEQVDRRDIPLPETTQNGGIVRQARDWVEFWRLKDQGIEVLAPTAASRAATPPFLPTPTKTTGNKSMDLGSLIKDLGSQYIQTKYMPRAPQQLAQQVDFEFPDILGGLGGGVIGGLAGEALDYFMKEDGTIGVKKKCKKRRRRKRLATVSDIADLAALKSILGNGDAFKTWIATHSR